MLVFTYEEDLSEYRGAVDRIHDRDEKAEILLFKNGQNGEKNPVRLQNLQRSLLEAHNIVNEKNIPILGFLYNTELTQSPTNVVEVAEQLSRVRVWLERATEIRCLGVEDEASDLITLHSVVNDATWSLGVLLGVVGAGVAAMVAMTGPGKFGLRRRVHPNERTPLLV